MTNRKYSTLPLSLSPPPPPPPHTLYSRVTLWKSRTKNDNHISASARPPCLPRRPPTDATHAKANQLKKASRPGNPPLVSCGRDTFQAPVIQFCHHEPLVSSDFVFSPNILPFLPTHRLCSQYFVLPIPSQFPLTSCLLTVVILLYYFKIYEKMFVCLCIAPVH